MEEARLKAESLEEIRKMVSEGTISKKVGECMEDVINTQNPALGADLVALLKEKKSVAPGSLPQGDAAEVRTLLMDLLVDQQSKTQQMLSNLNNKIDSLETHVRQSDILQQAMGAIHSKVSAGEDAKK
jgi:hypothetical protein